MGFVLLLMNLILAELPLISSSSEFQCPSKLCSCEDLSGWKLAICGSENITETLSQLDPSVDELQIQVESVSEEIQSPLDWLRFVQLKSLTFTWIGHVTGVEFVEFNHVFNGLSNLTTLNINIPTRSLNPELLINLSKLQTLDLSHTRFLSTSKLVGLWVESKLKNKPIRSLILKRSTDRAIIDMQNERGRFDLEIIYPLFKNIELEELDISDNNEVHISPGLLKYLPKLKVLRIGQNIFTTGTETSFVCILLEYWLHGQIQTLDFTDVQYSRPQLSSDQGPKRFTDFGEFHTLFKPLWNSCALFFGSVDQCDICMIFGIACIQFVYETPCDRFPSISDIYKADHRCSGGFEIYISPNLERLLIGGISMRMEMSTERQTNRQVMCFGKNQLQFIEASHSVLTLPDETIITTFLGLDKVEQLTMINSDWVFIFANPAVLHTMPSVKVLSASGNHLQHHLANDVNCSLFAASDKLEKLRLVGTHLYLIHSCHFHNLTNLKLIDLSINDLLTFEVDISELLELQSLNLSGNPIVHLSSDLRDSLELINNHRRLTNDTLEVDLSGADLSCTCHHLDFVLWIQTTPVTLSNKDTYLCHHPQLGGKIQMTKVVLQELDDFCFSGVNYGLYLTISIVPVSSVLLLLSAIYTYRRRWTIRYFLYAIRHSRRIANEMKGQYAYDGFIVYNEHDRHWVHDTLLPKLETEMKMKLCLHYRDFIPGINIEDQIVASINKSRRTVLIVTPNFLKSHWCDFEMQMARNKLFSDGMDVLVLIILERFPLAGVNKTMRNLLDKKTYLEWYSSEEGQKLFWKQLRLALCPAGVTVRSLEDEKVTQL